MLLSFFPPWINGNLFHSILKGIVSSGKQVHITLLWLLLGWLLANPRERKHQNPSVHCVARLGTESSSQWRLGHQTRAVFISFRTKSRVLTMAHKALLASLLTCWTRLPRSLFVLLWPLWLPRVPPMYYPYSHLSAFNLMFTLPGRIFL